MCASGHFEHFYYRREPQKVQQLADYVIRHHWPQLRDEADKYLLWFRDIVTRTAQTIASWQTVGFAHGVMNTDNMIDSRSDHRLRPVWLP